MVDGAQHLAELLRRIESKQALIGVVGLGYVGLPVAVTFAEAGFRGGHRAARGKGGHP